MNQKPNELTNIEIHNYFSQQKWQAIKIWTTFQFEHVSTFRSKNNSTALHLAFLFNAPGDVVDAILYAAPELASTAMDDGELPIHWAARVSSPIEMLAKLLKVYPRGGLSPTALGVTALSLLWERSCYDFFEIYQLCKHERMDELKVMNDPNIIFQIGNICYRVPKEEYTKYDEKKFMRKKKSWEKIMLLLRASQYKENNEQLNLEEEKNNDFNCPLHHAVENPVPMALTAFLHKLNPDHMHEKNKIGRLPLSIAVASPYWNNHPRLFKSLLQLLMKHCPEAVSVQDWMGRLPLALAIESGKTWNNCIRLLLEAEPRALSTRDELSRMYPFMLASVKQNANEDENLQLEKVNLTFNLLRENPECIRIGIVERS